MQQVATVVKAEKMTLESPATADGSFRTARN